MTTLLRLLGLGVVSAVVNGVALAVLTVAGLIGMGLLALAALGAGWR